MAFFHNEIAKVMLIPTHDKRLKVISELLIPLIVMGFANSVTKLSYPFSFYPKKHLYLLLGVMFAFSIVDGIAVLMDSWTINIVPIGLLKIFSGIIFTIFRQTKQNGK